MTTQSPIEEVFASAAVPVFLRNFGVLATHRPPIGAAVQTRVIHAQRTVPVGDYGEHVEERHTIQVASSDGAEVGSTWTVGTEQFQAEQLTADDNIMRTFEVRLL